MKRYALMLGVVLVAGAVSLRAADDKEDDAKGKKTAEEVKKIADQIKTKADWAALSKSGEALAGQHSLEHVMRTMKLRRDMPKSGLGLGGKPGDITPDGIEAMITLNMTKWKKGTMPGWVKDKQEDLARAAEIVAAVATISIHQCPVKKKMGEKDPEDWKKWTEEMHKHSVELSKALREKTPDPDKIRTAAAAATRTCNECHAVFRD